jgi:hypothetical protein
MSGEGRRETGRTDCDDASDEPRTGMNDPIGKVPPVAVGVVDFLLAPLVLPTRPTLRTTRNILSPLLTLLVCVLFVLCVDAEGSLGSRARGPVVGHDGDLGVDVRRGGRAGGRWVRVQEVRVGVWLGRGGWGVVRDCVGVAGGVVGVRAIRAVRLGEGREDAHRVVCWFCCRRRRRRRR